MSVPERLLLLCCLLPLPAFAGDPTRPPDLVPAAQEIVHAPLHLSMVLTEGERRRAVINGKLMAVSDWIGNARLVAIRDDSVVMRRAGHSIVLKLPLPAVRQDIKGVKHE